MVPSEAGGAAGSGRYRFGDIVVDEAAHSLLRAGVVQPVEPKAFTVLLALLRRPGELIGRDELLDAAWGHRHVTPGVLTRAIAQLRNALGDDPQQPRYIQTRHALGYRFIGQLQSGPGAGPEAGSTVEGATSPAVPGRHAEDERQTAVRGLLLAAGENEPAPGPDGFLDASRPARAWSPRAWRLAAVLAAALLAALLWSRWQATPPSPAEASIAILPFASLGRDRDDDYFAEGLAVEMHDALAGVDGLKVAAQLSPAAAVWRETDVKALGALLGVATVLDASVRREGERVRINARLSDCRTGYTLWSRSYDRELSDVFATQSEIAGEVVQSLLGILPDGRETLAGRLTPTRSVVAFDAYLRGLQQLRLASGGGSVDNAIGFFSQALEQDSGFARAQAGICRSELVRFTSLRNADAFENARTACGLAQAMNPESSEVDLALADMHRVRGEYDEAMAYYAKARRDPARAPGAYVGMAQVRAAQGHPDQALADFRRALELSPGNAPIYSRLGYQQYLTGDLSGAIDSFRTAVGLRPDDAGLWSSLGGIYLTTGNRKAAGEALERSIRIKPTATVLSNYGELKFMEGDYAAAATLLRRAIELDARNPLIWGNLGNALLADPATARQAREAFMRAAEIAEKYVDINPDDAIAMAAFGWYLANLGEHARARELVVRSEALGAGSGEVDMLNAQTLMLIGSEEEVLQRLAAARGAGIPDERIETNPFLKRAPAIEQQPDKAAR